MCGTTPRDVFPRKAGVNIDFRPGNDRRPRRGASAPEVLRRVKSSISGGSWPSLEAVVPLAMAMAESRDLQEVQVPYGSLARKPTVGAIGAVPAKLRDDSLARPNLSVCDSRDTRFVKCLILIMTMIETPVWCSCVPSPQRCRVDFTVGCPAPLPLISIGQIRYCLIS